MVVGILSMPLERSETPQAQQALHEKIRSAMVQSMVVMQITKGITGLGWGAEAEFARLCLELRIPYVAAVPWTGWRAGWEPGETADLRDLLAKAENVVAMSDTGYAPWKIARRNDWILRHCEGLICVWDESEGWMGDITREARNRRLRVKIIDPRC